MLAGQPVLSDSARQPLFEPLPPASVFTGCGCTFSTRPDSAGSEAAVLFSSDYKGSARIASRGAVIQLLADRPDTDCRPSRVGSRCILKYRSSDARVVIKARATWVCPADDTSESCEVVRLGGRMAGGADDLEESVEVNGECGC